MDESLFEIFRSELTDLGDANCDWWSEISVKNEEAKETSIVASPVFKTPLLSSKAKRERNCSCRTSQKELILAAELADSESTSDAVRCPQLDWTSPISSKLATGDSSNQGSGKMPPSLHTLLDDRSNVSWSSAFATPLASNVTWSNLNSEEKKVLVPSNSVTTPTAFSPGIYQEQMDHCRLLDCTFDIAGISSQDPSLLEKSVETKAAEDESHLLTVLDKDERNLQSLKELNENKNASQVLQVSNCFCSPLKSNDFRESMTPDSGVADGAFNTRTNRTVDQGLNSTSTAVIRNLFKNFNHLSKTDPKYQTSANDSGATGFSHSKLSGDKVYRKVQETNATCSELNTANTANSQDFLDDLSINTLNELCQTTEMIPPALCSPDDHLSRQSLHSTKKIAVRRTSTPIQQKNTKWQMKSKFLPTELEEGWAEEGDSIMEQAAQELKSPEKDKALPDAASRVQEIKNASVLRRFVYSVNDDKLQENSSCKIQIEDLVKSAEILEQAVLADSNKKHGNLVSIKTMANETQEFLSFSKLNSSVNSAEISSTVMDQMNNIPNRSYKNMSSISSVWNDRVSNKNEAVDKAYSINIQSKHLTAKLTTVSNKQKKENKTASLNQLDGISYFTTSLPKQNYSSEYKMNICMENEQNQLRASNTNLPNDVVYAERKIICNKDMPDNLNSSSWNNEHCSSASLNEHNSNSGFMSDLQIIKAVEQAEIMHTLKESASNNNYSSDSALLSSYEMSAVQDTLQMCHKSTEINPSNSSGNITKNYIVANDNSQIDAFTLNSTIVQQLFDDNPEDFKAYTTKNNVNPNVTSSSSHHTSAAAYQLNPNMFCEEFHETKVLPDKLAQEKAIAFTDRSESAISDIGEKIVKSEKNSAKDGEYDAVSDLQQISEGRTSPVLQSSSNNTKRLRNKYSLTKNFKSLISRKDNSFKKPKFSPFKQNKENVKKILDDFEERQSKANNIELHASYETEIVKTTSISFCTNKGLVQQEESNATCSQKTYDTLNRSVGVGNESVSRTVGALTYKSLTTKLEPCDSTGTQDVSKSFEPKQNENGSVKVLHFQDFSTESGTKTKVSRGALSEAKKLFADKDFDERCEFELSEITSEKIHLQDSATASGKKVNISSAALQKVRERFVEVHEDDVRENCELQSDEIPVVKVPHFQDFATATEKNVNVVNEALNKTKKSFVKVDEDDVSESVKLETNETPSTEVAQFQGFATASGKKVNVSSKALLKAKKLFAEEDAGEQCGRETNETPSTKVAQFQGFATASGKKVNVSSNSLLKAKKLFAEEDAVEQCGLETNESPSTKVAQFQGFATASGKKVNVCSKALLKAKKLFAEEDAVEKCGLETNETPSTKVAQFQGFAAASGKKVNVSSEALLKAKKLFAEEDAGEQCGLETNETPSTKVAQFQGFATASGKKVNVSSKALLKAKKLFAEEDAGEQCGLETNETPSTKVAQFQGFAAASGKKVNVSSKALLKAKKLFAEEDAGEQCGLETNETPSTKVAQFQGFATASGKKVNVSSKALLKAKKLFAEEDAGEQCGLETNETPSTKVAQFQGFATASGKQVNVSSNSLLKAKKLFAEEDAGEQCGLETNETPSTDVAQFQGFATASGKKVNVSSNSLLKAKKLFTEEDAIEQCGLETNESPSTKVAQFQGFATASGKKVNVSSKALLKAKKLFAEEDAVEQCGLETNKTPSTNVARFQGFATASGKKVNVSSEALLKAKVLLAEKDANEHCGLEVNKIQSTKVAQFKGFATASGKKVGVSNEALLIARQLFIEDKEDSCSKSYKCGSNENLETKVHIQGFPLVNDNVKIFEESLCEKKTFLEEFNNESNEYKLEPSKSINKLVYSSKNRYFEDKDDSILGEYLKDEGTIEPDFEYSSICTAEVATEKPLSNLTANVCTCILEERMCGECSKKVSVINNEDDNEGRKVKIVENFHSKALKSIQKHINSDISSENICDIINETTKSVKTKSVQTAATECNWSLSQEVKESAAALLADDIGWSEGYISCPDMVNDRDVAPSAIISDSNSSSILVPQPGSPILCGIKRQCRRNISSSQNHESSIAGSKFKVPYKSYKASGSAHSVSVKSSKRTGMNLDFGTPFAKRLRAAKNVENRKYGRKQNAEEIPRDVCSERLAAAEEQECLIKKRLKLGASGSRPCTGSLYTRKREQQLLRWRDVANGRPPEKYTISELQKLGVKADVLSVTAENALEYRFCASDFYSESFCLQNVKGIDVGDGAQLVLSVDGTAGLKEVTRAFLASPAIEPSLVPAGWVSNHYRWLIWKLAATERRFPLQFAGRYLTPNMLMLQLKYRYDREIDHAHRPALRKILEHDDSPAKRLVLCVARIIKLEAKEGEPNYELELTDGWYGIMSCIDRDMCRFINKEIICIGTKLITYGAELVNSEQPCSPLEVQPNVRLKLSSNSTRRARWDTKLGFYPQPGPLSISLTSILPVGGPVGSVKVIIARKYPLIYIEKVDEGKSVVRTSKLEERVAAEWERKRQECAEALFSQVRAEFQQYSSQCSGPSCIEDISKLSSGDELCRLINSCSDPGAFERILSEEQKQVITNYRMEQQQQIQQELEGKMRQKLEDLSSVSRTVIPVFKVRCVDPKMTSFQSAMLSIWRPSEEVMQLLKEGVTVNLFNVTAAGQRGGHLLLTAGRHTRYQPLPNNAKMTLERTVVSLDKAAATDFHPPFGEVDIVGIVVHIGAAPQENSGFQIVYLCDVDMNILGVAFWGGIKQYGWEDLLVPRAVVACCNLNKRHGASVRWVPCVYASEYSSFSSHPRMAHLSHAFTSLQQSLLQKDLKKFYSSCEEKVIAILQGATPPIRRLSSVPLASNSSSSICNADVLQKTPESSAAQRRMRRLEQYGEPPPLSPLITLPVPLSLRKEFHIPIRKDVMDDSPPLSLESDPG